MPTEVGVICELDCLCIFRNPKEVESANHESTMTSVITVRDNPRMPNRNQRKRGLCRNSDLPALLLLDLALSLNSASIHKMRAMPHENHFSVSL